MSFGKASWGLVVLVVMMGCATTEKLGCRLAAEVVDVLEVCDEEGEVFSEDE